MPDLIRIVDLKVWAYIGVPDAERAHAQQLLVSVDMTIDSYRHAAGTDNLAWTIHYGEVAQHIQQVAGRKQRKLLESLSEEIAAELFKSFPIRSIVLEIKKFVLPGTRYVSVEIERKAKKPKKVVAKPRLHTP